MKIITCASYYNTGSSAITDFFGEFDNCKSLGDTEFKFLQDSDGVQALESNIIEHPHRHNTSHAIKRFIKACKFENGNIFSKRYRKIFGDNWMKFTLEYVDAITQCKCHTMWRNDKIERGDFFYMIDTFIQLMYEKTIHNNKMSLLKNEYGYYSAISKEDFYRETKRYTSKLFGSINADCEYLMVDQLAAPSEANKYMNYVDDLYIVITERDPRDLFIIEKTQNKGGVIPVDDIGNFCSWYKITRDHRKHDEMIERAILIYFEDLIYHYDETAEKLIKFTGNNALHHMRKKTLFDPNISIKGTRVWEKHPEMKNEISYIENELEEYLYPY